MKLGNFISTDGVITKLKASSKKQVLQELAQKAAEIIGVERRKIFDILVERERLGTTGVGGGVAIPHGKVPNITRLYGLFARAETAVEFDSIDGKPVDLIFLLLAPEAAGADHLKALAKISRLLKDPETCTKLRNSDSSDEIYAVLMQNPKGDA